MVVRVDVILTEQLASRVIVKASCMRRPHQTERRSRELALVVEEIAPVRRPQLYASG